MTVKVYKFAVPGAPTMAPNVDKDWLARFRRDIFLLFYRGWNRQMSRGWIGVDLDGTLAEYYGWRGTMHIGAPVPAMLERVRKWLAEGKEVRIFTARVSHDGTFPKMDEAGIARSRIEEWCLEHLGQRLQVTCSKDYGMIELWDDRCVSVVPNTGEPYDPPYRATGKFRQ
jgi:hypothetical protein